MEEACNEDVADQKISKDAMDLTQILTMLTHQITTQNTAIQDHIQKQDVKFENVMLDNKSFKTDMRAEKEDLRALIRQSSQSNISQSTISPNNGSSQTQTSSTSQAPSTLSGALHS